MRIRIVLTIAFVASVAFTWLYFSKIREPLPNIKMNDKTEVLPTIGKIDQIIVHKSQRIMQLLREGQIIVTYKIALGGNPKGHKQQEGDERTPEGRYIIDWRNPKSSYFLSLHISYPNEVDSARAKAAGVSAGGMIMIHGQPNGYEFSSTILQGFDWTNGCIAVTNAQMQQIWDAVPNGTPIEIRP